MNLGIITTFHSASTWVRLWLFLFLLLSARDTLANDRPNFLVIIADDMGYSDAGCYGGEIATPNLDQLAAGGLRFTQFYNTARCWPTRSALVTGYYPQQIRRDGMPGAPRNFGGRGKRPEWAKTIADYLKPAGYRTYHSGKWHIDGEPTKNGFDLSNPTTRGPGFFETTKKKSRDPSYYETIETADFAIECLKEHASEYADKPFFAYVAFRAPHFPLHALPEDIARYRDRYTQGWNVLRKERHERQQELGLDVAELSALEPQVGPPYAFPDQIKQLGSGEVNRPVPWNDLTAEQKEFQAMKMSIHAAMIDRMDREIGRILDQLRSMNAMEETFICFLSDNGASAEIMVRGDGHDPTAAMGSAETYLCLGPGFSSAANTPFRRHKTWVHEGGISTPFIVHWPGGIKAKNEFRSSVAHVIDIAPTILDLAGVKAEVTQGISMSGKSLKQALLKDGAVVHDVLWFYHEGNRALRQGDWKIVYADDVNAGKRGVEKEDIYKVKWSLYDLSTDRAEQQDLSEAELERVKAMVSRWDQLRTKFLSEATQN
ncbi:arylsulfatase [Bremerella sp. P1]|nr:arylsulfatase [Bremerella sp. P1]WDI41687.1 arylsulfatase [Bremerella sp. P1]